MKSTNQPFRVAACQFFHETCTFSPGKDTALADWYRQGEPRTGDAVFSLSSYIRGFAACAGEYGDMQVQGLTSPVGVWGGTSRSWHEEAVFDHFVDKMLDELRAAPPVDGVYLALHGAMAVRNIDRPEAEMARRFRAVVGPDVPIVATFDFHGNVDEEFLRHADGILATKCYPHYDAHEQGERAARYLRNIMRGAYSPAKAVRRIPILTATVLQWTGKPALMAIMERARRWEQSERGAYVNVFFGFPWADTVALGMSVHVMTDNHQEKADHIADDMVDFIWRSRNEWAHEAFPSPEEAARLTHRALETGQVPVVLAEYSDRPGDATWLLNALAEHRTERVLTAALTDSNAIQTIWEQNLQPGDRFVGTIGGYTGDQAGPPFPIDGELLWRGPFLNYDQAAAIRYHQNNVVILTPGYLQVTHPEEIRIGPINPDDFHVIHIKSRVHFRGGFDETGYARQIHIVDAPGDWFGTARLNALEYHNICLENYFPFSSQPDKLFR